MSQRVAQLVFSPLLILGPDLKPRPHLASGSTIRTRSPTSPTCAAACGFTTGTS